MAEKRRKRGRTFDQVVVAALVWFVPIGLFGYVGFSIAEATGRDPYSYLPSIAFWQIGLLAVAALALIGGVLAWRAAVVARAEEEAKTSRWDNYSTPFESKR